MLLFIVVVEGRVSSYHPFLSFPVIIMWGRKPVKKRDKSQVFFGGLGDSQWSWGHLGEGQRRCVKSHGLKASVEASQRPRWRGCRSTNRLFVEGLPGPLPSVSGGPQIGSKDDILK